MDVKRNIETCYESIPVDHSGSAYVSWKGKCYVEFANKWCLEDCLLVRFLQMFLNVGGI